MHSNRKLGTVGRQTDSLLINITETGEGMYLYKHVGKEP